MIELTKNVGICRESVQYNYFHDCGHNRDDGFSFACEDFGGKLSTNHSLPGLVFQVETSSLASVASVRQDQSIVA